MGSFHKLLNEVAGAAMGRELARTIGKSSSYVSQIRDATIPSDTTIALIAEKYAPDRLGDLLLAAAQDRVAGQDFEGAIPATTGDPAERRERGERLREAAMKAFAPVPRGGAEVGRGPATGRTLRDFPEAFYPLAVVTGDKREDRGFLISVADFGAYSASPADTRWIFNLGLGADVVKHIDKNFLLLTEDRLVERFAEMNLLVIGSPASNHLARMVNGSAVFRFNYSREAEETITREIEKARGMTKAQLSAYQVDLREQLSSRKRALFAGGICDPTNPPTYVTATYAQIAANVQFDFGVLTFCANPFYERLCRQQGRENDHKYVAILAAGIHHPATAHAVRLLGRDTRRTAFDTHPYGGVIRVVLDIDEPFSERTEKAAWFWDDEADEAHLPTSDQKDRLLDELAKIESNLRDGKQIGLELRSADQAAGARELILRLAEQRWEWRPEAGNTHVE